MKKTGIDVSHHQGIIDWKQVNVDFAFIRAGWSWYEGGMNIDKRFVQNASDATTAKIPWGVYLYAYDKTPEAAEKSANILADLLDKYKFDYPVAYDFEDNQYLNFSRWSNTQICDAFLKTLQSRGYYCMLYTYTSFAKTNLYMDNLSQYDLWIADYTGKVGWTGPYGIWQYSSKGKVPGIATNVDMNEAYKDYPSIIKGIKEPNSGNNNQQNHTLDKEFIESYLNKITVNTDEIYDSIDKIRNKLNQGG